MSGHTSTQSVSLRKLPVQIMPCIEKMPKLVTFRCICYGTVDALYARPTLIRLMLGRKVYFCGTLPVLLTYNIFPFFGKFSFPGHIKIIEESVADPVGSASFCRISATKAGHPVRIQTNLIYFSFHNMSSYGPKIIRHISR